MDLEIFLIFSIVIIIIMEDGDGDLYVGLLDTMGRVN